MADVVFYDYATGRGFRSALEALCKQSGISGLIRPGSRVAIKLHMGELGNATYLRPSLVRRMVDLVKDLGGKPFVTDTTALYPGARCTAKDYLATAAYNGFAPETMGAPIVIADGDGHDGVAVKLDACVDGCDMPQVEIASSIYEADFLLCLSHLKGHMISGFGGAIKNMAMGCVTKQSKMAQHRMNPTIFDGAKCDSCESCVDDCPTSALSMVHGKPVKNAATCIHCSTCLFACTAGAWYWSGEGKQRFQVYLAHAGGVVMDHFKGRAGFLNFIQDVTPQCDCAAPAGRPVVPDIGVVASLDPVAVDKAAMDLVDGSPVMLMEDPPSPPDRLGKLHGVDSLVQLTTAHKLGLGEIEYRLVNLA